MLPSIVFLERAIFSLLILLKFLEYKIAIYKISIIYYHETPFLSNVFWHFYIFFNLQRYFPKFLNMVNNSAVYLNAVLSLFCTISKIN